MFHSRARHRIRPGQPPAHHADACDDCHAGGVAAVRWWGLTVRKQLAFIFLDGLKQKEEAASEDTPVVTEGDATEPTAEAEVAAE